MIGRCCLPGVLDYSMQLPTWSTRNMKELRTTEGRRGRDLKLMKKEIPQAQAWVK